MPRGSGFLHLNTPAVIAYSPGQQLSLTDLQHVPNREECIVLPPSVSIWRAAFRKFVKLEALSPFVRDAEAVEDGMGPILPAVAQAAPLRKRSRDADHSDVPSSAGITVVSHHKLTGERRFVYPDHDGILSSGVVPRVVASAEEQAAMEADRQYFVSPLALTEEEQLALEELKALWKCRANSRSVQGAQHRALAGTVVSGSEGANENFGNESEKRWRGYREEPQNAGLVATGDDALDEALRLAGELLDV